LKPKGDGRGPRKPDRVFGTRQLEMVSKDAFRQHYELITQLIGNSPGVYALYDDAELYYVGKSSDLRKRVKQHLRDRHLASWTHFSLYLAANEKHIHEIESLLIRIANPRGNRIVPKGKSSGALLTTLKTMVRRKQKNEFSRLFGGVEIPKAGRKSPSKKLSSVGIVKIDTPIFKTYKAVEYRAILHPDGQIKLKGKVYGSPTAAAKSITNGPINGLRFWNIEDLNGDWIKLGTYISLHHAE
jgi:hypothetical protein